jgi:hypothetical protein
MINLDLILKNKVAIKVYNYYNGKKVIIHKLGDKSNYYGTSPNSTKTTLLASYNHSTYRLDINDKLATYSDSTLRKCIMEYVLHK